MSSNYKVFSVCEDELTQSIAEKLGTLPGNLVIDTFSDGEFSPQFKETIREKRVFLICSTNSPEKLLKLFLTIDAARRASASEIVAVIPYYGYARQDRKEGARGPIGAKVMSNLLVASGIDRLVTLDLHASQIQGFLDIPVDHINGIGVFRDYFKSVPSGSYTIVSPDAGGVTRAMSMFNKFEKRTDCDITFAMMSKRRDKPNSIGSMELIGDVEGRNVILVDDMTDTAGTILKAAEILKQRGAQKVTAIVTHAVLSGNSPAKIDANKYLDELIISDSLYDVTAKASQYPAKIKVNTCANAFSRAILAIISGESMDLAANS
jgi:ribose-phosphate pyrophosphokinase